MMNYEFNFVATFAVTINCYHYNIKLVSATKYKQNKFSKENKRETGRL